MTLLCLRDTIALHKEDTDRFIGKVSNEEKSWDQAWYKMIYCILAGTQVTSETAQKAYKTLCEKIQNLHFSLIHNHPEIKYKEIMSILKDCGYRFPTNKANCIKSAASKFYEFNEKYELTDNSYLEIRKILINQVKGLGPKITSHWLRNVGFDLPIVDIHTRRILVCADIIDRKFLKKNPTPKEYFQIEKEMIYLSRQMGIPAGYFDFALWKHGKTYCSNNKCRYCPINKI